MRSVLALLAGASAVNAYTVINHKQFMTKNVDALVLPGTYKSHMHSFFGSDVITNVKPTTAQLQKGCYSGENPNDLSVYWIPTLYYVNGDNHTEIRPYRFSSYYNGNKEAEIPFPPDFAAIAGNAAATSQADVDYKNTGMAWSCEGEASDDNDNAKFPTKTCSTHLQTILRFPDCVNPSNLTQYEYSAKSYVNKNYCSPGMKRIPELRFSVRYDLRKAIPGGWKGTAPLQLSCGEVGDGYCFHGDFINGWYADAAKKMMEVEGEYQFVGGEHGKAKAEDSCTPTDADPDHGTSDYAESVKMKNAPAKRGLVARKSLAEKRAML